MQQAKLERGGPSLASAPTANEIPLPPELQGVLGQLPPSGDIVPDVPALPPAL